MWSICSVMIYGVWEELASGSGRPRKWFRFDSVVELRVEQILTKFATAARDLLQSR
jgi:hypothetical protein